MRLNRRVSFDDPEDEKLGSRPHIGLWCPGPRASRLWPEKYSRGQDWYVAINWYKSRWFQVEEDGGQCNLGNLMRYPQAYSEALWWAKKLGLPLIKQGLCLLWIPGKRPTSNQRAFLSKLMNAKSERAFERVKERIIRGRT